MKLGLVTYNIAKDWDLPTIIKNCAETRFQGVELRTTHAHGVESSLTPEQRADVRRMFRDSGVELVGLGSAFDYHSPDPAELRRNIEGSKAYVDLAADLGTHGIKVRPNDLPEGVPVEQTLKQIGVSLNEVGRYAKPRGVQVRLEVHGRKTANPRMIRTILDIANHENVVACWNSNANEVKDGSIKEDFDQLAGRIGLVHTRDLFEPYPWRELFQLLAEEGYRGYTLIEAPATSDPIRVMHYIRALWEAYQPQPA
jgi:sugar phosphate isomerase/epimerase